MKILAITTAGKEYMYSIKSARAARIIAVALFYRVYSNIHPARGVVSRASCHGSGGGACGPLYHCHGCHGATVAPDTRRKVEL